MIFSMEDDIKDLIAINNLTTYNYSFTQVNCKT